MHYCMYIYTLVGCDKCSFTRNCTSHSTQPCVSAIPAEQENLQKLYTQNGTTASWLCYFKTISKACLILCIIGQAHTMHTYVFHG